MKKKTLNQIAFYFTAGGCAFFIVATLLAMFLYPGGNRIDPNSTSYSFTLNYFSNLGMMQAINSQDNTGARILFTLAALIAGLGLIPYFLTIPNYFSEKRGEKIISWIFSIISLPISLAYVAIGLTPADIFGSIHGLFTQIAFSGTFPIILVYTVLMYRKKSIPRYLVGIFSFFVIITFAYLFLLFFGPSTENLQGLMINVVGQKIVIYTEMISMVISGIGMAHYAKKTNLNSPASEHS